MRTKSNKTPKMAFKYKYKTNALYAHVYADIHITPEEAHAQISMLAKKGFSIIIPSLPSRTLVTEDFAERYADFIILTADNSRTENLADILHDIINGMTVPEKRHVICNRADAIRAALGMAEAGDTVLLIGKGHEEYMIDKSGKHNFSERGIVFGYFEQKA